jgi:hypothetical protein
MHTASKPKTLFEFVAILRLWLRPATNSAEHFGFVAPGMLTAAGARLGVARGRAGPHPPATNHSRR